MKKFLPIIIIIALAVVILCFAACGNDTMDDTITSVSDEMTSMMDDMTTVDEALSEDMSDMTEDMTSASDTGAEDMSDMSDTSGSDTLGSEASDTTAATP